MKTLLLLSACLMPAVAQATEWMECVGKSHSLDLLVGVSNGSGSIDSFMLYAGDGTPEDTKNWAVAVTEIDLKAKTARFAAKGISNGKPDIALAISANKGSLKIGNAVEETECDWQQAESGVQQGVPADRTRPAGSSGR